MLDLIININNEAFRILLMSMLPITEQRLSIPYFIIYEQLNWLKVIIFSICGNVVIGLIVYYIISPLLLFYELTYEYPSNMAYSSTILKKPCQSSFNDKMTQLYDNMTYYLNSILKT